MLGARAQRYRDITQARATTQMAIQSPQPAWDGAIRTHGFVVRRLFGLNQTVLLTPRPASGLHAVAHVRDLIRGSI